MSESNQNNLQKRLEQLEKRVEQLERKIADPSQSVSERGDESARPPRQKASEEKSPTSTKVWPADKMQFGEQWLNRIGIGLLLIGIAFLFKYSIDQGWLIPPVRSAIGLGMGVLLFGGGLRLADEMSPLKQILLGGGIAVFYITGFATFQLYHFVPSAVIWVFMIVVTLLSLSLSMQQDEAILSVVGTVGALGTPFMLYTDSGGVLMLMAYTALVLTGAVAVYVKKGWKSLLWSIALGGALVIFVGIVNTIYVQESPSTEQWALQSGALFWMAVAWLVPVWREVQSSKNPVRWPDPARQLSDGSLDPNTAYRTSTSVHLVTFVVPLLMLVMTLGVWEMTMRQGGLVAVALAVAGSSLYLPLKDRGLDRLAATSGFLGLSMLTVGFVLMLEGNFLIIVLAVEAVGLRFVSYQTNDDRIDVSSHLLYALVFLWVVNALYYGSGTPESLLDIQSLTQLAVIAAGSLAIPRWLQKPSVCQVYQLVGHLLFLGWLFQKLSPLENGQAWATIAWAAYAIALLIWGFMRRSQNMRVVAMGTIFLVVGKLFLIDLSQLEAIWRILIFIVFGAALLLLGYFWQAVWSNEGQKSGVSKD